MRNKLVYSLIFLGILVFPSMASAHGGLLSGVVDQTTKTVDQTLDTADTVLNGKENEKSDDTVLNKTSKIVDSAAKPVKSVTNTVENTVKNVVGTKADEKLVDVDLGEKPKIKVNTGIADIEVDESPSVKIGKQSGDTSNDEATVNVKAGPIETEVSTEKSSVKVEVNHSKQEDKPSVKQHPAEKETDAGQQEQPIAPSIKPIEEKSETVSSASDVPKVKMSQGQPLLEKQQEGKTPVPVPDQDRRTGHYEAIVPAGGSGGTSIQTTGSSGGTGTAVSPAFAVILGSGFDLEYRYLQPRTGKSKIYYDQWLNAPPSEPPKSFFFLNVCI
ncbi:hypothetical protein [Falsibacillus pallidus]|uniref:hypothetical protein n=1 Tax=Falsibacillus pallidus TaxID=493781 RepID=UPI003D980478